MPDDSRKWDISRTGYKSDAKKIIVHLYEEEGDDFLYELSARQSAALLKLSVYLEWPTRYDVLPTDLMEHDDFVAWNDEIKKRLIVPFEICAKIIDCIENDEDVRIALNQLFNSFMSAGNYGNNSGYPLSTTDRSTAFALGFNPSCDVDIIWAQASAIVERSNTAITDLLDTLADETTAVGMANVLAQLPLIENLGVGTLTALGQTLLDAVANGYASDYDVTYADALKCEIFCSARSHCEINFNDVFNIIKTRVTDVLPTFNPPDVPLQDALFFVQALDQWANAMQTYASELAAINHADFMFYFLWGTLSVANIVIGENKGKAVFDMALALAADEPSNDWETLCTDCPEEANITLVETYPGTIVNSPTFLYNTPTGGSVWEATYFETAGIALNAQIGGIDVPFNLISASPVTSYQHVKQGEYPTLTTGSGDGASESPLDYLGLIHTGGVVATIEVEPL